MSAGPQEPRRVRRPTSERFKDFISQALPVDKAGDDNLEDLLAQLKDERDRRSAAQRGSN